MRVIFIADYCPCCHEKRVTGDVVTEEQLKDIIDELENDKE